MKIIKNTKLFKELRKSPEWAVLFFDDKGTLKDSRIPVLVGGLDHIKSDERGVYFFDIGTSQSGHIYDNSFGIEKETEEENRSYTDPITGRKLTPEEMKARGESPNYELDAIKAENNAILQEEARGRII